MSVTDKSGLVEFARGLAKLGIELISTDGTARLLRESGLAVTEVAEVTGFSEMLEGRVKTLHPAIHGGLLARRDQAEHLAALEHHGIRLIDLLVVNLYQFEQAAARNAALEELVEQIDIGGPSMIRSAAKNFRDVAVVVSPEDYQPLLSELEHTGGQLPVETCWRLAQRAFAATAAYDAAIAQTLAKICQSRSSGFLSRPESSPFPSLQWLSLEKISDLRYGENPHQQAALYRARNQPEIGLAGARQLQGKPLSYNNLVDLDAAWELVCEFRKLPRRSSSTPIPAV